MVPAPDQWIGEVLKDPGISCMFGVHGGYACKVIILDLGKYNGLTILGIAVLIMAVAAAWFVVNGKVKNNVVD